MEGYITVDPGLAVNADLTDNNMLYINGVLAYFDQTSFLKIADFGSLADTSDVWNIRDGKLFYSDVPNFIVCVDQGYRLAFAGPGVSVVCVEAIDVALGVVPGIVSATGASTTSASKSTISLLAGGHTARNTSTFAPVTFDKHTILNGTAALQSVSTSDTTLVNRARETLPWPLFSIVYALL